jgi:isoamylase
MRLTCLLLSWTACRPPTQPELYLPSPSSPGSTGSTDSPTSTGDLLPLGASVQDDTLWFAVASRHATRVEVWLYGEPTGPEAVVLPLSRTGPERFEGGLPLEQIELDTVYYGLRVWGPNWEWDADWVPGSLEGYLTDVDAAGNRFNPNKLLSDPYGRELSHDPGPDWGPYTTGDRRGEDTGPIAPKSVWLPGPLDPPSAGSGRAPQDQVIYEVHVRGLSMLAPEVPEALRGTYAGAALVAPRLAALGVTALELMPLHETPNDFNDVTADASGDNYWGYSSLSFFAPDRRYAADRSPGGPTAELRAMIDAYHEVGIDVLVDVVYNHTAEGGTWGDPAVAPLLSWRGLDNAGFYELADGGAGYRGDNGVGPNWNAVEPLARQLVLDSLRYWSEEIGVDGFRFDLAPILGNSCSEDCFSYDGHDPEGVLVRAATELDVLLVAEPWGATGEAYQGGNLPQGWAEWNDGFRDTVRRHQNGVGGAVDQPLRPLVDALMGSPSRFADDGRQPWSSVSYVVAHDGFTLADLYRCDAPDNDQDWPYGPSNGGSTANWSWDQDGDEVAQERAARTGMALSLLSAGIPMFNGGDELLRSQRCNNNPYNLDSVATWIDWPALEAEHASFYAFTRDLIALRAAHPALRPAGWRGEGASALYEPSGAAASDAYLDDPSRHALALYLDGPAAGDPARALLVLINGWEDGVGFTLPPAPSGERWHLAADTHEWLAGEDHVVEPGAEPPLPDDTYLLGARSVAVLVDP